MITTTKTRSHYLELFERSEQSAVGNGTSWLAPVRKQAINHFLEIGFPTPHQEDWRYTNVASLAKTSFQPAPWGGAASASEAAARLALPNLSGSRLVFVDARFAPELSALAQVPAGVVIGSLAEALAAKHPLVETHLTRHARYEQDAFAAMNTAFIEDGLSVHIPRGVSLPEPIHVLYLTTASDIPLVTHPRNLIIAEDDSRVTILEDYASVGESVHFSNVVSELVVGERSICGHYRLARESRSAFNISTLRIQQARDSVVASHALLAGGKLVRNKIHPVLAGEGCTCNINGLFLGTDAQHLDNYMLVEHASPNCSSRQFYNGILGGKSHGVFHGRIHVHPEAQGTDAKQTNKNLLLSDTAQIDTKPQLEIYANDVKCTHGATIGQIDEEAIFYLRSRGLDRDAARAILLLAFAGECIERMEIEPLRHLARTLVRERVPRVGLLETA